MNGTGDPMADMDFGNLRMWLDEHARYAGSFKLSDPGFGIAQRMLSLITEAKGNFHPSDDSTANYLPNKEIVGELAILRDEAEKARDKKT